MTKTTINTMESEDINEKVKKYATFYRYIDETGFVQPSLQVYCYDTEQSITKRIGILKDILTENVGVKFDKLRDGFVGYYVIKLLPSNTETLDNVIALAEILSQYGSNKYEKEVRLERSYSNIKE